MNKIRVIFCKNRVYILYLALLLVLVCIPLYKQGVMCNDELVTRLLAQKGFKESFLHYVQVYRDAGRPLAIVLDPITIYLGFLGDNNWSFRVLQIITILATAGLFAVFLDRLFHNRSFAAICGISIVVFLPVTFEHTAPNAFNTLFNIPFCFMLLSLILYTIYLEMNSKRMLVVSMTLLLLNLTSYESFVMFLPLYWCIAIAKTDWKEKRRLLKAILWPTLTAAVFLSLYILLQVFYPADYSGIQVEDVSLRRAGEIIWQLFRSSFPGYYLFDPEYQRQAQIYNKLKIENYVRAGMVGIFFGLILYKLLGRRLGKKGNKISSWGAVGSGVLCIILPTLPNAVAKMYQQNIGIGWWVAVPTSYFCYFGATFLCWFVIWRFLSWLDSRGAICAVAIGVTLYLVPVQCMNDIFAQRNNWVFHRITTMEALFSTELAQLLEGKEFYSKDFFKHINILDVHDSYWNDFAEMKGLAIKITNGTDGRGRLYFDDEQIVVWYGDKVCVLVSEPREEYGVCRYSEDEYKIIKYEGAVEDNGFFEYYYQLSDNGELVPDEKKGFFTGLEEDSLDD